MERDTNLVELATALTVALLGNSNTRTSAEDVHAPLAGRSPGRERQLVNAARDDA